MSDAFPIWYPHVLHDAGEACFVSIPCDEYANAYHGHVIIKAQVEPNDGIPGTLGCAPTLHVLEPAELASRHPRLRQVTTQGLAWVKVENKEPGTLGTEEWARLILDIPHLSEWMYAAALRAILDKNKPKRPDPFANRGQARP